MRRLPLVASCGGDSLIPDCPAGRVATLTREAIENLPLDIFVGPNFSDVRRAAALEVFARYYPEEYQVWEKSLCDVRTFDPDHFLASSIFMVEARAWARKSPCWWPAIAPRRSHRGGGGPAGGIIEPEACRAGDAAPRNSVGAAWQHWRLEIEDRALIVGEVFCRAHGRRLPAAFLPGQRTVCAIAVGLGWVSVRGAGRSPGFRARGLAALAVRRQGSRVNSG